jgi:hypothetical protein
MLSLGSAGCVISVASAGSILSYRSAGSILSIRSQAAFLAVDGRPMQRRHLAVAAVMAVVGVTLSIRR